MINGLEGIPGSGKSYEAVVMHVLPSLRAGRRVITNLPLQVALFEALDPAYVGLIELRTRSQPVLGIWDAEGIDDKGNGQAFKLADVRHFEAIKNVPVFGSVWDYYSDWKHPVTGVGPLFIIDEAHLALPVVNTHQEVIEWYKLHRHFNADVLLATQSFRDINQPVARLMAMLIRCRKADILGRKDSYIRKVHAGYRGAVISQEERKYEAQFFGFYKSHTQGNSVAESIATDVAPLSVKLRRFTRGFWGLTLVSAVAFVFWYTSRDDRETVSVAAPRVTSSPAASQPRPSGAPATHTAVVASSAAGEKVVEPPDLEPLKDKGVHITGWLKTSKGLLHTFTASGGGARQFTLVTADLVAAGYTFRALGDCMGYLTWETRVRVITCDPPVLATGRDDAPVVMDFNTGKRSDDSKL